MKKKQLLIVTMIASLIVCFCPLQASYATKSVKKQKKQLKEVQAQKDDISEELSTLKSRIRKKQKALNTINSDIRVKEKQIAKSEKELEQTKKDINARKDGLNKRLRNMYKSGSIGYLDVILGSNSVEELVTNVDLVQKIFSNDQNILTELKSQKKAIQEKEAKLKKEKSELSKEQEKQKTAKASLDSTKVTLQAKYDSLEKTENKLKNEIAAAASAGGVVYSGGKWAFPLPGGYTLTSHFGEARSYESHPGVDLAVPTGTPVYAAQSGKVVRSGSYGGYGYAVVIYHGNGLTSVYGHNSRLLVSAGQTVKRGQKIALAGSTGWSTGSHLHFEVRNSAGTPISPRPYIGIS